MKTLYHIIIGVLAVTSSLSIAYLLIEYAESQEYKVSDNVSHIKFISSNNLDALSQEYNRFIVNKTFESRFFELKKTEFFSNNGTYTILIEYEDVNKIIPDAVTSARERALQELNNVTEGETR